MSFLNHDIVLTADLRTGMVIAQPVFSESGQILLEQGVVLTCENIKSLQNWHVATVWIKRAELPARLNRPFINTYKETLDLVAATFTKVQKFKEVPIAECKELAENYIELMIDIEGVLDSLYRVKTHHAYTFSHSLNVSILTGLLGKWMGFKGSQLKNLILSGLLHDIGKAFIPQKILDKPGPLSVEEMEIVKTHTMQGYNLLSDCTEIPEAVKLGVLQHHERENGSGYPLGLKGGDVHIFAKFVAVADVYDAMTTERVYRKKLPPFVAINQMLGSMGNQLDSIICLTLLAKLWKYLIGTRVLLSNGMQGQVIQVGNIANAKPVIQLDNGHLLDLDNHEQITIVSILEDPAL
ncbi:HD-GYP domain-containing protein [Sporomusa aerivorans]|uniref:HD-GYP domain-containing protein n=1 Tax=Sporomusa aerivorans TaxID=204936 RepID=UPI00352B1605